MLLVASETGHVYTFATRKLQPMITSESGKALIQTCLNSPDNLPATTAQTLDQRMNPGGFEEPELTYGVSEDEQPKVGHIGNAGVSASNVVLRFRFLRRCLYSHDGQCSKVIVLSTLRSTLYTSNFGPSLPGHVFELR